jgi:hypothetical protein
MKNATPNTRRSILRWIQAASRAPLNAWILCVGTLTYLLPLTTAQTVAPSGPIVVRGTIWSTNYSIADPRDKLDFELETEGGRWRLTTTPPLGKSLGYCQIGVHGGLLYSINYNNTSDLQTARQTTNLYCFTTASIVTNTIPKFDGSNSRLLWLAAAPHTKQSLSTLSPCEFYGTSQSLLDSLKSCPYSLILDVDDSNQFIRSFTVYSRSNYTSTGKAFPLSPPFDKGQGKTLATFRQTVEKIDNRSTKRRFVYTTYFSEIDTNTITGQRRGWEVSGELTQSPADKVLDDMRPLIKDRALVNDFRAHKVTGGKIDRVDYYITKDWPAVNDVVFLDALQEATIKDAAHTGWWKKPVMFLVFTAVILAVAVRSSASNTSKTKDRNNNFPSL